MLLLAYAASTNYGPNFESLEVSPGIYCRDYIATLSCWRGGTSASTTVSGSKFKTSSSATIFDSISGFADGFLPATA